VISFELVAPDKHNRSTALIFLKDVLMFLKSLDAWVILCLVSLWWEKIEMRRLHGFGLKVRDTTHGSGWFVPDPFYICAKANRESHQRKLVDCSGPF